VDTLSTGVGRSAKASDDAQVGRPGTLESPVLTALRRRRDSPSPASARSDGLRLALAVEGGAMRGVVSAAMLCAIEDLGFGECF
jgi:hypothetical protein